MVACRSVVVRMIHGLVPHVIGGAVDDPALDAAPGQQHAVALRIVIATGGILRPWTSAEFAAEYHDRRIQQSALLQIADEAGTISSPPSVGGTITKAYRCLPG
jgi:hypothetical protein